MFDLDSYMVDKRGIVDGWLDETLPSKSEPPVALHSAMRYSVFSGGKRVRPIICIAAAESIGALAEDAGAPATALELLHTYTLIHDDLPCMDDDDVRRGKPTCHVAFGDANAVLAGDALQALAFETLARTSVPAPFTPGQLLLELASAAGSRGVVGGQADDMVIRHDYDVDAVEHVHLRKTAALFRAAARMGGIVGGAPPRILDALTGYAVNIGLAFQMVDDLLDGVQDNTAVGQRGATCLAVYSVDDARARAQTLVAAALSALDKALPANVEPLTALANFIVNREH